jgi:hypothetical protein
MRVALLSVLIALFCSSAEAQVACPYSAWTDYRGTPLLRHPSATAYLYATSEVEIDADGAPNAYHPDDVALNCASGTGFKGLDCPANAGFPSAARWKGILAADPVDPQRPFVQPAGSRFAGFFVSETALQDAAKPATDPARYVDSTAVPYIVFPGAFNKMNGTGLMGDLGYAVNLDSGLHSPFVVADIGPPDAALGEMSIALAAALGGHSPNPRTGAGAPRGKILYVVFPRSVHDHPWPQSAAQLAEHVDALLNEVGGADAATACKSAL